MKNFVHLHLHSEYSLLDGACRIAEIPKAAKAAGHTAVAITDHGALFGAVHFYKACKKEGIKPIIGCEVYVARRSRFDKAGKQDSSGNHLVLLVKNETGYRNLIKMVSLGYTEGFYSRPRIDLELLRENAEGLIALSACVAGQIPRDILAGDMEAAYQDAVALEEIMGKGNFYLELQNHGIEEEKTVRDALLEISEKSGIPLVATNDVHYLKKSDAENQAVLMCVQTGSVLTDGRPLGFETNEFYYKSTEEMEKLFGAYQGAIENTGRIADACTFEFAFGNFLLPVYRTDGTSPEAFLRELAEKGLAEKEREGALCLERFALEDYRARMDYELSVIHRMGFDSYFLVVWDFVNYAKGQRIAVGPGRGSGAGSLVAFLVGITDVDSLRYDLLFERFLNPERISMPDFDIDFADNRRDEVIAYVRERYGEEHVSQIITFGTMAARAAIRDVGRALGMPYGEVDAVAKLVPRELGITIQDALKSKELAAKYEESYAVRRLLDISMALEGMPRHASTHAAGVVITPNPVCDYVPLSQNGDITVTEYDMDTVAELGLIKFDFLGIRYLTIIADAEREIRESDPTFSVQSIPFDDEEAYRMIGDGDTMGVFQLESGGMRQMLMHLKPSSIEEITAAIALYRPGPMDSIPHYIARKFGKEPVVYDTAALEPVLKVTYGCIVYQEQVMQIFRDLAGYSLARADLVRRAMAKKKADVLEKERVSFMEGCLKSGISADVAGKIFDNMASFAKYAFNKSHATAYAVTTYRTAYLKRHYPAAYFSALLTSVLGSQTKVAEYISEAGKRGIRVLPPDINESRLLFSVSGKNIRFGLLALKNVGRSFVDFLIRERERNGRYQSFESFLSRVAEADLNKRQIESLIKSGAFDSLGVYRSRLLATYEQQLEAVVSHHHGNVSGQLDLFSTMGAEDESLAYVYPELPEFSTRELLLLEKESSGLYFSGHLLDDYTLDIASEKQDEIVDILSCFDEGRDEPAEASASVVYQDKMTVSVSGIITEKTVKETKNGARMAFCTLEDRYASFEIILFPKQFESLGALVNEGSVLRVKGQLSVREDDGVKLLVSKAIPLKTNAQMQEEASARKESSQKLYLRVESLKSKEANEALQMLALCPGEIPVYFYERSSARYVLLKEKKIKRDEMLLGALRALLGADNVILQ